MVERDYLGSLCAGHLLADRSPPSGQRDQRSQSSWIPVKAGLLKLKPAREDASFREGFWKWIALMVSGDFSAAVTSIRWGEKAAMTAKELEERIATFFNESDVMVTIIPNERLVSMIDEKMEIEWDEEDGWASVLIPVSQEPQKAKEDDVSLMGISVSFFIVKEEDHQVLEFEHFHV